MRREDLIEGNLYLLNNGIIYRYVRGPYVEKLCRDLELFKLSERIFPDMHDTRQRFLTEGASKTVGERGVPDELFGPPEPYYPSFKMRILQPVLAKITKVKFQ